MELLVREISPDEVEQEVTQRDQFNTDAVGLVETLVREALQNSMDGRLRSSTNPVRTRIAILNARAEDAGFWASTMEPLRPHLEACEIRTSELNLAEPRLLVIEDFETTGLLGATDRKDQHNFSDFWRRTGRSHKRGEQSGRWGLGKLVFSSSSKLRTFFGLTVQADDSASRRLLMGSAVLKNHVIAGEPPRDIAPHAFFAVKGASRVQLPEMDAAVVDAFVNASGIRRRDESGLSIVVPFLRNEITTDAMLPHIIRNWFFPILTGQLIVEVGDLVVDQASFAELATQHGGPEFEDGKRVAFIKGLNAAREAAPTWTLAANWHVAGFAQSLPDQAVALLREEYASGKLTAVRVPLSIRPRVGVAQSTFLDLYLQSSVETPRGDAFYVRGAITIPGEAKRFKGRNCLGALVAEDSAVATFLGDAEGPAHTAWSGTAEKVVEAWKNPGERLREVRDALNQFYEVVAQIADRVDPAALIDVFFVNRAGSSPTTRRRNPVVRRRVIPPIPRNPAMFRLDERKSGFVLGGTAATVLPLEVKVRVAYDLVEGNPLKQHSKYDFDVSSDDVTITTTGATVKAISANELRVEATTPEFSVVVNGFDENRDLFVKAEVVK